MSKKKETKKVEGVITDAPYCTDASLIDALLDQSKAMQTPIEEQVALTNALCKQHDPIAESLARPVNPVDEANEAINKDYPWAVPSMTSPQRAILCELYRIRKALETK